MLYRIYSKEDAIIVTYDTDVFPDIDSLDKAIDTFRKAYESPITEATTISDRLISEGLEGAVDEEIMRLHELMKTVPEKRSDIKSALYVLYHVLDYRYL